MSITRTTAFSKLTDFRRRGGTVILVLPGAEADRNKFKELSNSLLSETFVSLFDSWSVGREKSKERKSSDPAVLSCFTRRHCCLRVST